MLQNSTRRFHTFSSAETKTCGARLAGSLRPGKTALVIGLSGELGSGKTTFVQGFVRGLGLRKRVTSPTFILMQRHPVRARGFQNLYHIDCYRIKKMEELAHLGFRELMTHATNLVLIEWAERVTKVLPRGMIRVDFQYGEQKNERSITIRGMRRVSL